jgi:hypothetical protein
MERAASSLLPHSLSMMLCDGVALKGCATLPEAYGEYLEDYYGRAYGQAMRQIDEEVALM